MISVQHPPAIKVGGRRLSISTKTKHHTTSEARPLTPNPASQNVDYPRPAAPGDEHSPHHNPPPHTEEEVPSKKEKKHWSHENEMKLKELAHRKTEGTRPSKDMLGGNKGFGAAGRIAQPAGKGLNL